MDIHKKDVEYFPASFSYFLVFIVVIVTFMQ